LLLALLVPAHARAQSPDVPPDLDAPSAEYLPQDQLDALLAPIALYPDDLLAQVLMASTYPLEVVEAARFVQQNPALTGRRARRRGSNQALGSQRAIAD